MNFRLPGRAACVAAVAVLTVGLLHGYARPQAAPLAGGKPDSPLAALGKLIFRDASLSASGRMSCATCHSPDHAYGPPDGKPVQLGGPGLDRQGDRSVPTLRYVLNRTPRWHRDVVFNPVEAILEGDKPPSGGFAWDGRFDTLHDQAAFPLLAANEMANKDAADVAAKLAKAAYAGQFRKLFGDTIFDDPQAAFAKAVLALERYELEDPAFRPYSSKFDAWLDGKAALTAQELRGKALFDDPDRGNCASCHIDKPGMDGSHPIFTDYEFEALGVPRNPDLAANGDAARFDQGLCGPVRKDQVHEPKYCGLFKTPTLRNVATRGTFFHNGRYHTLKDALRFYVQRDTDPGRWYPAGPDGKIVKFDDLPAAARANIDVIDEPLTRKLGGEPAWNDAEIDDVMAFLETLTDRDAKPAEIAKQSAAK